MPRRALPGGEQLDRVAGRVLDQHLAAARPGDRLVAEGGTGGTQPLDRGVEILDLDDQPVPAARLGAAAIRHRTGRGGQRAGEPESQVVALDDGHGRAVPLLFPEAELVDVEGDRGIDIRDEVTHRCHGPVLSDVRPPPYGRSDSQINLPGRTTPGNALDAMPSTG